MRFLLLLLGLIAACSTGPDVGTQLLESRTDSGVLCDETCGARGDKYLVCHLPPGNPENEQTLCVGSKLVPDHLYHGDHCGECGPQEPVCGDEVCEAPENCAQCPDDCGTCPPVCGDGECEGEEDCGNCERDCGYCPPTCGDELCELGESCSDCPSDCGTCPPECGNQVCEDGETCSECPADCGTCPPECGDGLCETGEACESCPTDCGLCPPVCGNGECEIGEDCSDCPGDCGGCPEPEPEPEDPVIDRTTTGGGVGCNAGSGGATGGALLLLGLFLVFGAYRLKSKILMTLSVIILLTSVVTPVFAQEASKEFQLERFEMPMTRDSTLNVESGDVPFKDTWGLNLFLGYANDPLVVKERIDGGEWNRSAALVGDQVSASLGGFIVPHKDLALGLRVPMALYQDGEDIRSGGLGDVTLLGKYQLLEKEDGAFADLAVGMNLTVPTRSSEDYIGESFPTLTPYVAASRWMGSWTVSANAGIKMREDQRTADLRVSDELFARLGVSYGWDVNELALTFSQNNRLMDLDRDNASYSEVMGGYIRHFAPGWTGFVGAGTGLNDGFGAPDYRVFLGLRYEHEGQGVPPKCGPLGGPGCPETIPEPKPEPEPEPEPAPPPPAPKTPVLVVSDAYFDFDKDDIKSDYRGRLLKSGTSIAKFLSENRGLELLVVIEGHTDSIGNDEYNQDLGHRRARAVAAVFMEAGVPADLIRLNSFGETKPRASNSTAAGRAANRRVEVYFVGDLGDVEIQKLEGLVDESTYDGFGNLRRK